MTGPPSLRASLLVGAILWTIGLLTMASVGLTQIMLLHPGAPEAVHGALSHVVPLSTIAFGCMVAGLWQVRRGVSALEQLRHRLAAVRTGHSRHIDGTYPAEVQPLVDDLNLLIDHREQVVQRALSTAGDLAHGLKTPLAVLSHEADRAERTGSPEVADVVAQQVERMHRHVSYHLARARAAASAPTLGARSAVDASAQALARTLRRLHADRGVTIEVTVQPTHAVRCQREDVDEMIGNLLDNACKWARSRVLISSSSATSVVEVAVDDDGPGLAPEVRDLVLRRGVRLDEATPGSGLGLAIVRDLAELYGGSVSLTTSPLGGVRARLELPSAESR